jgi:hypothetical protein
MADVYKPLTASTRDAARRRGESHFTSSEAQEGAFRAEVNRERKATDAKTAKLRALRLAKEEEDRIAAANAPPPVKKTRAKKAKVVLSENTNPSPDTTS